jgi:hypothetical protein
LRGLKIESLIERLKTERLKTERLKIERLKIERLKTESLKKIGQAWARTQIPFRKAIKADVDARPIAREG